MDIKTKKHNILRLASVLNSQIIDSERQTGRTTRMIANAQEGHTLFFHTMAMADEKRKEYNLNPENTKDLYFASIKQIESKYIAKPENIDHVVHELRAIDKINKAIADYLETMEYNNE